MGLHFTTYLIYGRVKNKSLVGNYKPGTPGYDTFRKLVDSNKYLAISVTITLVFIVNTMFDVRRILHGSSSHSILLVVPVMVVLAFLLLFMLMPTMLGKKR